MSRKTFSETEIKEGIRHKDPRVLEYLYKEMVPVIYQDIIQNSGNSEDAKDNFQDAMLVVTENIKNGRYQSGNIKGYIRNLARNIWQKHLRYKGLEVASPNENEGEKEDGMNYERYLQMLKYDREIDLVEETLKKMGNPCYEVLKWHYYQKQPLKTIAHHFAWSYAYCKKKVFECRKDMKKRLEQSHLFKKD